MQSKYTYLEGEDFAGAMNRLGSERIPFLFIIDFAMQQPVILPLADVDTREILYNYNGNTNLTERIDPLPATIHFSKIPISFNEYQNAFNTVIHHLQAGNSFLVNLTFPTEIRTNLSLKQLFFHSQAKYKLWFKDQFVVFSPETFIQIHQGRIYTYPMKGTLDAILPDAEEKLLTNQKELAEHVTIVDLLRNDLSIFASNVRVNRFRYVDQIRTHDNRVLLQVSSAISGTLPANYHAQIGNIIQSMLPAGSICGAPKPKTLQIIREAEIYNRGYYTGIMGIFDGENLDSGVLIRFIERQKDRLFFKSGGGITTRSDAQAEYQEMIEKVYVPISRIH